MDNNIFVVNTLVSNPILKNALHDKIFQIKALVECIRLAATTHELTDGLIYDVIWAIDSDLEQVIQLQESIDES